MGTHPIFESDFDCLTELIMGRKDRKRLSAILDGGTTSDPVKKVKKSSTEGPMKKKESDVKKLTAEEVLKNSKQDDFLEYLKEENPEMLEELEGGDLGELSASSDEEEDEPKLDGEDSFDEDGFDFGEDDFDEGEEDDRDPEDEEVEMGDIDLKLVTEEKISKWTDELAAMDHRGLLPLSQALYASILAVDDRDAANNDKKKQKKMDKMTDKMTSTTEIFPIICSSVIEKVPEFLLKS